jgi:hypothetical protein
MNNRTCCHCLHKATPDNPVTMQAAKSGELRALCQDRVKCWDRWDKAHNLSRPGFLVGVGGRR